MALPALLLIGILAGFISGLLGVGGGVLLVPALVMFGGVKIHQAIGISLAVIVPTAFAGFLKHYHQGALDLRLALVVAITAVVGAVLGAWTAGNLPAEHLRKIFAVFMIVIGVKMFFSSAAASPQGEQPEMEIENPE